jgi:hypothetical protein
MQNGRIRAGQLLAFCAGLVLLASLSQTWFRPMPYTRREPGMLNEPQTAWQAFYWADWVLAGIALAALVVIVAMAFVDRGDALRVVLLVLAAAGAALILYQLTVISNERAWPLRGVGLSVSAVEIQNPAWVALVSSVSLLLGIDGIQAGPFRRLPRARPFPGI